MNAGYGRLGERLFLGGMISMAVFIPTSNFMLSVTQFYLIVLWMLVGIDMRAINKMFPEKPFLQRLTSRIAVSFRGIWNNIKTRFSAFLHNKVALIMVSMYLLHIVGMLYTSDFQYGFKDIRIKVPILLLPILFSSIKPINRRQFDTLIWFLVASLMFVTIVGAVKFFRRDFIDVRELSVFESHIRVCLCMVFSIFSLLYLMIKRNYKFYIKLLIIIIIFSLLWFIHILESFISIILIVAICTALIIYFIIHQKNVFMKVSVISLFVIVSVTLLIYVCKVVDNYLHPERIVVEELDTHTKLGNPYVLDTINYGVEDGRYIGLYLAKDEMIEAWNERSDLKINKEFDNTYSSVVRYLTSKDLRKDAEGVSQLTSQDIKNIESGIDNYNYIENPGFKTRIMKVLVAYEKYSRDGNANGSSVFQRVEYIKASFDLIKEHPVFGIGTGDINNAFVNYYEDTNSSLLPQYRFRSHNQYLAITIAFGIVGLLYFLFTLLYPYFLDKRYRNYFYSIFMMILLLSMFTEDTIESQVGVTFFAFFNSFLVFISPYSQPDFTDDEEKVDE